MSAVIREGQEDSAKEGGPKRRSVETRWKKTDVDDWTFRRQRKEVL